MKTMTPVLNGNQSAPMIRFVAIENLREYVTSTNEVTTDSEMVLVFSHAGDTSDGGMFLLTLAQIREPFVNDSKNSVTDHIRSEAQRLLSERIDGRFPMDGSPIQSPYPDAGDEPRLLAVAHICGGLTRDAELQTMGIDGKMESEGGGGILITAVFVDQEVITFHVANSGMASAISSADLPIEHHKGHSIDASSNSIASLVNGGDLPESAIDFEVARYITMLTATPDDLRML